jgi:site-specific DNA-methyltransferase (adenine-specific)
VNVRFELSLVPLTPNPKYKVIYADPPWEYRQSGSKKNSRGMAKQHYRTMSTDEICGLPIQSLAAEDALLFLWATFPNISEALKVMEAWGFQYKTAAFVWVKKNRKAGTNFWGMGAYTRANAEVVLLGVKPKTKARQAVKRHDVHQIVEAPVGRHSAKPDEVRQRIVDLCGDVPRVELFAREKPDGWDVWGDEVASDFVMVNRYHLKEDKQC